MATISTYVSGHTETGDVAEFFQKQLLNAGERPIAFFDGVFYESHQERVGNIAYQDYLVYSDRAIYLWARGADKDYLDRFALGAVSINSRNKDNDFATLNLRIRREGKEPVYVIFDMVEIAEADKINTLHTIIESIIENSLGSNFRNEIPDEIADHIFRSARNTCPPSPLSFNSPPASQAPGSEQDSRIGYGQDLLEQYKASIGYAPENEQGQQQPYGPPPGNRRPQPQPGPQAQMPPGIPKGLEGVLPTDPEALKRIASNLRDTIGDAPFKFRDQVMKDLQHVPNDVATVLSAINELVSNIADNPQAEKFVLNAIQTAVKNDGILGSVGKMLKLTTSFGPMGKTPPGKSASGRSTGDERSRETPGDGLPMPDENSGTIRRKKVKIQADSDTTQPGGTADPFDQVLHDMEASLPSAPVDSGKGSQGGEVKRKKVTIVADESQEQVPAANSSVDDAAARQEPVKQDATAEERGEDTENKVRSRKVKITTEEDTIPPLIEEQLREALQDVGGHDEEMQDSKREKEQPKVYRTMESGPKQQDDGAGIEPSNKPQVPLNKKNK